MHQKRNLTRYFRRKSPVRRRLTTTIREVSESLSTERLLDGYVEIVKNHPEATVISTGMLFELSKRTDLTEKQQYIVDVCLRAHEERTTI